MVGLHDLNVVHFLGLAAFCIFSLAMWIIIKFLFPQCNYRICPQGSKETPAYHTICLDDQDLEAFMDRDYNWHML